MNTQQIRPDWTGNASGWEQTLSLYVSYLSKRSRTIEEINRTYRLIGAHLLMGEELLTSEEQYQAVRNVCRDCLVREQDLMLIRLQYIGLVSTAV